MRREIDADLLRMQAELEQKRIEATLGLWFQKRVVEGYRGILPPRHGIDGTNILPRQ